MSDNMDTINKKLIEQWENFIISGFHHKKFTKDLYAFLKACESFKAHFNRAHFYNERFAGFRDLNATLATMRLDEHASKLYFTVEAKLYLIGEAKVARSEYNFLKRKIKALDAEAVKIKEWEEKLLKKVKQYE